MKDLKDKIFESSSNLCTFYVDKFDHEEVGNMFIRLGESLHAFDKGHEFSISHYKDDDGKYVIDVRVKDKSYNEYFKKKVTSK